MKFLKALLLIVVILAGVWVVLCLLGPSELNTKRSMVMSASPGVVYSEVTDFNNWQAWSPWHAMDTTMVTTVSDQSSGKGAVMEWTSQNSGDGKQTITDTQTNKMIATVLTFSTMPGEHRSDWFFEAEGEGTKVTWTMESAEVPFLVRGLLLLAGGTKPLEEQYDQGLTELKAIVEARPSFEPEFSETPGFWYIGMEADSVTAEMLSNGKLHEEAYIKIQSFMAEQDLVQAGMPITVSRKFDRGLMNLTFGLPVADSVAVGDGLIIDRVPAGRIAFAVHKGPYENVDQTWNKFDPYFEANPQTFRYYPFEQYLNDPAEVRDSTEYLTRVVFPVN